MSSRRETIQQVARDLGERLRTERESLARLEDSARRERMGNVPSEEVWADRQLRTWIPSADKDLIDSGQKALSSKETDVIIEAVIDRLFGLGPIDKLLRDPNVSDIHVFSHDHTMLRTKAGEWMQAEPIAENDDHLLRIIETAAARHGAGIERRFDQRNPELNMQLRDGSRMFAARDVVSSPTMVIRKHDMSINSLKEIEASGMVTPQGSHFLEKLVQARLNAVIVGATSSGKMEPLSSQIPTPTGRTTVGELQPGDEVFGSDGQPVKLLGLSPVKRDRVWTVTLEDGRQVRCGAEHLWEVSSAYSRSQHTPVKTEERQSRQGADDRTIVSLEARIKELPADLYGTISQAAEWADTSVTSLYRTTPTSLGVEHQVEGRNGPQPATKTLYPLREVLYRHLQDLKAQRSGDVPLTTVLSTEQLADSLHAADRANWAIEHVPALDLPDVDLAIDPYLLGAWLGDGTTDGAIIWSGTVDACTDQDGITDQQHLRTAFAEHYQTRDNNSAPDRAFNVLGLKAQLRAVSVLGDKHIPSIYLRSSQQQRLALLAGLMDTDGTVDVNGSCELTLSDERLANDALGLIRTLGIKASLTIVSAGYRDSNGDYARCKDRHRIHFTTQLPVFRLPRKAQRCRVAEPRAHGRVAIVSVEQSDEVEEQRCLYVDSPDHLYLTGDYVPTHNTTLLRALCACMPPGEKKITIEEAKEIGLEKDRRHHPLVTAMETRPPDMSGEGAIEAQQLVRMSLRMDCDRIILGEVRGGEALQMLTAMTQGQRGSLCTMHGESAASAYPRLQLYVKMGGLNVPDNDVARLISDAVHFVVFARKEATGEGVYQRRIHEIIETRGVNGTQVTYNPVMNRDNPTGELLPATKPSDESLQDLLKVGFNYDWFMQSLPQ